MRGMRWRRNFGAAKAHRAGPPAVPLAPQEHRAVPDFARRMHASSAPTGQVSVRRMRDRATTSIPSPSSSVGCARSTADAHDRRDPPAVTDAGCRLGGRPGNCLGGGGGLFRSLSPDRPTSPVTLAPFRIATLAVLIYRLVPHCRPVITIAGHASC
jgi:hypothetical protein